MTWRDVDDSHLQPQLSSLFAPARPAQTWIRSNAIRSREWIFDMTRAMVSAEALMLEWLDSRHWLACSSSAELVKKH